MSRHIQPAFTTPATPAGMCLHLIRHLQPVTRGVLIEHTGRSQPTITRAIAALSNAKLVRERPDRVVANGPGRPTIPIELAPSPWVQVGVAIGTKATYIGAYSTRGVAIREHMIQVTPAAVTPDEFSELIAHHTNLIVQHAGLPLANFGLSTPGEINEKGQVTAPNLGWEQVNIIDRLRRHIQVPITATNVIHAIGGAEQQAQSPNNPARTLLIYADDSIGAALITPSEVRTVSVRGGQQLEETAAQLSGITQASEIVLAGSAFESASTARAVAKAIGNKPIRVIPTHIDNARAAARAVAMDRLIADPLRLAV